MHIFKSYARALRRFHRARIMTARRHYWGHGDKRRTDDEWTPAHRGMVAETPQRCSACRTCGNPRRWGELTIQERRAFQLC